jgi:hypothetical protein
MYQEILVIQILVGQPPKDIPAGFSCYFTTITSSQEMPFDEIFHLNRAFTPGRA